MAIITTEISSSKNTELIKEKILEMITKSWTDKKQAMLVAKIGHNLIKENINIKKELGGCGLAEFIQKELSDKLKFISSPKDPMIKAAIPVDAVINDDINDHFSKPSSGTKNPTFKRIDFHRGLWKGFSSQLEENQHRIIKIEPEIFYEDRADPSTDAGSYTIPKDLIIPKGSTSKLDRDEKVQKNILEWLENNEIDIEKVKYKPLVKNARTSEESVFSILIKSLNEGDLERMVIPLDIIVKLQKKNL